MPEMLIGGEWRQAAAHEELWRWSTPPPRKSWTASPPGTPEDVELAVATAKRAFAEWSNTDVEKRAAILAKAADLIRANAKELAATLTSEQGKPIAEAIGRGDPPRPRRPLLRRGGDKGARRLPGAAINLRPRLRAW